VFSLQDVFDRAKVLEFFKTLFCQCNHIEGKSIKIMAPNADSVFSKGYQIHIAPVTDLMLRTCVEDCAKSEDLAVALEGDTLVIFNPIKAESMLK
jgi:hypothetical protein